LKMFHKTKGGGMFHADLLGEGRSWREEGK